MLPADGSHAGRVVPSTLQVGRVGVWLGGLGLLPIALELRAINEIERVGYGAVWIGESDIGREALAHASVVLAGTERVVVATGIANIWARDAWATNAGARTIDEAYPNRFLLGLGVSHGPQVDIRGHHYRDAYSRMEAYLHEMDQAQYAVAESRRGQVPRILAALGDRMLTLASEKAAGVHPYLVTPAHTQRARAILGPSSLLAPEQAVVLETEPSIARATIRRDLAFYLGLPNYVRNLKSLGFNDSDFADGGSDRLTDALVAWGDEGAIRRRVQEHFAAGADHVAIQTLRTEGLSQLDQLRALSHALLDL